MTAVCYWSLSLLVEPIIHYLEKQAFKQERSIGTGFSRPPRLRKQAI